MVSRNEMKENLKELIERYNKIVSSDKVKSMSEEQTKTSLIQPFFKLLNWNVEDPDEVTLEERVSKKRVDYAFKINGIIKFFVEAKSLKEDLNDPQHVEQAIKYSYNKGVTWAILTNFKEIKVFNAEWVPEGNIFNNQFISLKVGEFLEDDSIELLWLLSKESIISGELDRKAEKIGKKIKKQPIDKQLLSDLTKWRQALSKNILDYNRDKKFTEEELDEVVQRILDRLIFIRKCEDNGLEDQILKTKMREWEEKGKGFYTYIQEVFRYFDKNYDSELFKEHLSDDVVITNELLKEIISGLYETKEKMISYDFSVIDADVLGNVYEQYLGHILRKTEKRAKLSENHAHRKEQGIYYTPTYIVDYIVRNTLGELLKDKKVNVEEIRVLDPACGSGSFLIKAFDVLNEHYLKNDKDYSQTQLDLGIGGKFTRKVKILQDNIFGVDLDKQAVQIAQLNLLLKIAEKGHRLPLLKENIKNGNSLIDDKEIAGDKAFIWEEQFKNRFDVVVGNPPYINAIQLTKTVGEKVKEYWKKKYYSAKGTYDIFILFFEQAMKVCNENGYVSFITPNKYLSSPYGEALRELILNNYELIKVIDLSRIKVFDDPSVYPVITIIKKNKPSKEYTILTEKIFSEDMVNKKTYRISSKLLKLLPDNNWGIILSNNANIIQKVVEMSEPLEKIAEVQATSTASESDIYSNFISEDSGIPIINTGTIDRYSTKYGIIPFTNKGKKLKKPLLDIDRKEVSLKRKKLYKSPKIIFAKIALRPEGFLDYDGKFASINTNCIHSPKGEYNLKYLVGIMNSKLMSFIYSEIFSGLKMSGGYFQFQAPQLRILPIAKIDKSKNKEISVLVDKIISLNNKLNLIEDKKTNEKDRLESEITKTENEIDSIVYDIYKITDDEKKIIEDSLK